MASGDGKLIRSSWLQNTSQLIRITDFEANNQTTRADMLVDWFLGVASLGSTTLKVWNGSSWVTKPLKVWNGSSWVTKTLKRYVGGTWV